MPAVHNTTFIVALHREAEFLDFIRFRYLPILQKETDASEYRLLKITTAHHEEEAISYALQYRFSSHAELEETLPRITPLLNHLVQKCFAQEVIGFSTVMAEVEL